MSAAAYIRSAIYVHIDFFFLSPGQREYWVIYIGEEARENICVCVCTSTCITDVMTVGNKERPAAVGLLFSYLTFSVVNINISADELLCDLAQKFIRHGVGDFLLLRARDGSFDIKGNDGFMSYS